MTALDSSGRSYPALRTRLAPELGVTKLWADPAAFIKWAGWDVSYWQLIALRSLAGYLIVLPIYGCGNDPK